MTRLPRPAWDCAGDATSCGRRRSREPASRPSARRCPAGSGTAAAAPCAGSAAPPGTSGRSAPTACAQRASRRWPSGARARMSTWPAMRSSRRPSRGRASGGAWWPPAPASRGGPGRPCASSTTGNGTCAGRPGGGPRSRSWCARQRSIDRDCRVVVLAGLAEGVRLEVLYGLQRAAGTGRRTRPADVQAAVNILRAQQAASVRELSMDQITPGTQAHRFLTFTADQVTLALATPASETAKDDWDLRVFGHIPGLLRFSLISQQWLKETAKTWAAERIGTVETPRVMQAALRSLGALSESLRRNRPDGGADPRLIARADLAAFASDLSHLEAQGRLSPYTRRSLAAPRRPVPRRGSRHGPEPGRAPDGRASRKRRLPPGRPPQERLGRRAGTGAAADGHRPAPRPSRAGPPGGHARRRPCAP